MMIRGDSTSIKVTGAADPAVPKAPEAEDARDAHHTAEARGDTVQFGFRNTLKDAASITLQYLAAVRVPTVTRIPGDEKIAAITRTLEPGDLLLKTDNGYPGWQSLVRLSTGSSSYTHAAMYVGDGKVVEATSAIKTGVLSTDLKEFLTTGPVNVETLRPPYKSPEDRETAVDYCRQQVGKPYDMEFDLNDDSAHYCTELIWRAFQKMPNKIDVPIKTFLGKSLITPDSFRDIENTRVLYTDKSTHWKNMLTHWPVLAAGTASSLALGLLTGGSTIAIAAGMGIGMTLSTILGNKAQKGTFRISC